MFNFVLTDFNNVTAIIAKLISDNIDCYDTYSHVIPSLENVIITHPYLKLTITLFVRIYNIQTNASYNAVNNKSSVVQNLCSLNADKEQLQDFPYTWMRSSEL